jgi:hypothetical protein
MSNDFEPKSGMTRRSMLRRLGATGVSAVTLAGVYEASSVLTPTPAYAAEATLVEGIDVSHATPDLVSLLTGYFAAKSAHDPARTMSYFSQTKLTYIDATLGWLVPSWGALDALFTQLMPTWAPSGRSYPVRILGNTTAHQFKGNRHAPRTNDPLCRTSSPGERYCNRAVASARTTPAVSGAANAKTGTAHD